ncbi:MAG: KOW domain-containing RNA-binding protein [Ruminococcus sp.]|nr:KOW domain-containing RNA-binding protein [Ruminococcus sp.]HRR75469.1 KOW domain-containing RNA-binding protein [Ruminococcus sp.]
MKIQTGSVVIANAGRDSGGYFVVTACGERYCFIADGKSRKLGSPKRKNIKHIRLTDSMIDINDITDKKLRTLLRAFRSE